MEEREQSLSVRQDGDASRWPIVRELLVFQFKLALDGLKDIALAPAAVVATVLGVVVGKGHPGRFLRTVMSWGRGYDRWINLYGSVEPGSARVGLDQHIDAVEAAVRSQSAAALETPTDS